MPKVDEIDFNGNSVPAEDGQSEQTEVKEEAPKESKTEEVKTEEVETEEVKETEDVETLKERLKKVELEKENYKKGMFKYKDLTLTKKEEKKEEEYPDWDDASKKFQKQTESKAVEAARSEIEKYHENTAIKQFTKKHPEVESDWQNLVANYNPNHSKSSVEDYERALEKAYINLRYDRGELTNLEAEAEKKGIKKGKAEAQIADMSSVSKTTSKTIKGSNALSQEALRLAEKMRVNPEKLALEDDSLTAEIKF